MKLKLFLGLLTEVFSLFLIQLTEAIEKMAACPESRQIAGDRALQVRSAAIIRIARITN